ncbi:5'-hydroxyaverantin dehydrogenase [Fulvia fulva]|uniref:5'-hydroxyaverantin dehydrogenase n=1 Tax=Passalora fulva TaxID=5499 RepID=A0A9Q8P8L1_PASFU|nr:5'-hydroxyaverantin dehydrogenase [Fulvia fulva]KAK4626875.1 5'-hydroxyaverantin dehydrogenase [Fulvia fulva]UJO17117.1 5'-hydroxyaverantin dehydrogenase [Fulvia fulva]WPV13407.1 5'-hydroxyaverantin dehydrogenase [Fulvia fulva]WPV28551.1 5'-hydroxyaverantin dehydrogenase [Fulvia fulva]
MDALRAQGKFPGPSAAITPGTFDRTALKNKTVVLTGGCSGIGEATLRAFVETGAFVAFIDTNKSRGEEIAAELSPKVSFMHGDVTSWPDQKALFASARELSPDGTIDIVFANAGTTGGKDGFDAEPGEDGEPLEPDLTCVDINLKAVLYTVKLATHYWREPPKEGQDRSLILTASLAGYWDHTAKTQYGATKWGVRGIMRSMRSKGMAKGFRTNLIAPWYMRTGIASEAAWDVIHDQWGAIFAEVEDSATAVLHLAADNGANGRGIGVVPRQAAECGYIDLGRDELDTELEAAEKWHVPR